MMDEGLSAIYRTRGNAYAHTVLRGGGGRQIMTPCRSRSLRRP